MAGDHHAVSALRIEVEGFDFVKHVKGVAEKFQILNIRERRCTACRIDIAANGKQRSDGLQCVQNLVPPHVTGMKDQIRALQSFQGFGTHFAVGVCDYPDLHVYASFSLSVDLPGPCTWPGK